MTQCLVYDRCIPVSLPLGWCHRIAGNRCPCTAQPSQSSHASPAEHSHQARKHGGWEGSLIFDMSDASRQEVLNSWSSSLWRWQFGCSPCIDLHDGAWGNPRSRIQETPIHVSFDRTPMYQVWSYGDVGQSSSTTRIRQRHLHASHAWRASYLAPCSLSDLGSGYHLPWHDQCAGNRWAPAGIAS
jgi:hypothetical protein